MTKDINELLTFENVKNAYKQINNSQKLSQHPFANLQIVKKRHVEKGRPDDSTGFTVRELLIEQITKFLHQQDKDKKLTDLETGFLIIQEQHIEKGHIPIIQEKYGLLGRIYYRRKDGAYEWIRDLLYKQEEELIAAGSKNYYLCLAPSKPNYPLTGREEVIRELKKQIMEKSLGGSLTLLGKPGIGKTALAVDMAHDPEVQDIFKDGILWAGLGDKPDSMKHLGNWALALGYTKEEIEQHKTITDRQNMLKAALSSRKMLLIIDDAWESQSATSLEVGGQGCIHLFTSRVTTATMDFPSKNPITVTKLLKNDSQKLLTKLAPKTVQADLDTADELIEAVDGLPLALVVLGRYLQKIERFSHQQDYLKETLSKFRDAEARLKQTQPQTPPGHHPSLSDDVPISVYAIIALSEEKLSINDRKVFHSLSLFPPEPNTFSADAAMEITGANWKTMRNLADKALIDIKGSDRFSIHRVIHDFAKTHQIDDDIHEKFIKYFDQSVNYFPLNFDDLNIESENILASIEVAYRRMEWLSFVQIVFKSFSYFFDQGSYNLIEPNLYQCIDVAKQLNNRAYLIKAKYMLGMILKANHSYDKASSIFLECLELARVEPKNEDFGLILANLGNIESELGNYDQATEYLEEAHQFSVENNQKEANVGILFSMGKLSENRGNLTQAQQNFLDALIIAQDNNLIDREKFILEDLAKLSLKLKNYDLAEKYVKMGLPIAQSFGKKGADWAFLSVLIDVKRFHEEYEQAWEIAQKAYQIASKSGQLKLEYMILQKMSDIAIDIRNFLRAEILLRAALIIVLATNREKELGITLSKLGSVESELKNYTEAENYFKLGLAIDKQLGNQLLECINLQKLGRLYLEQKRPDMALKTLSKSLRIAKEVERQDLFGNAKYLLSRREASLGNIKEAIRMAEESLELFKGSEEKAEGSLEISKSGVKTMEREIYEWLSELYKLENLG